MATVKRTFAQNAEWKLTVNLPTNTSPSIFLLLTRPFPSTSVRQKKFASKWGAAWRKVAVQFARLCLSVSVSGSV